MKTTLLVFLGMWLGLPALLGLGLGFLELCAYGVHAIGPGPVIFIAWGLICLACCLIGHFFPSSRYPRKGPSA